MYKISEMVKEKYARFKPLSIKYLFLSRQSLADTSNELLTSYFIQEGLASHDKSSAIVDCASTGRTLSIINRLLGDAGYNEVFGYYIIKNDGPDYLELRDAYSSVLRQSYSYCKLTQGLLNHTSAFECLMSANSQNRTVGYQLTDSGMVLPVFSSEDDSDGIQQTDILYWEEYYLKTLKEYTVQYLDLGLVSYSKEILHRIVVPSLLAFFNFPEKDYVRAFEGIILNERFGRENVPYVLAGNVFSLPINIMKKPYWRRGTIVNSLPRFFAEIYVRCFLYPSYYHSVFGI